MSSFVVSRAARADLKNIAAYTQKTWGTSQRIDYLKGLDLAFHCLAENPLSGITCDYIISGLRKHCYESHIIFYENRNSTVFIARVLHSSMDVEPKLKNP
tara:strand:+ start:2200 stop:2499 length:300 start_codon:yes stop_codon:yes gene_type:complete